MESLNDDHWPPQHEVDIDALKEALSEEPFLRESFELLKEAAGLVALASGISTNGCSTHDRDAAVLVGHLVRMTKLMRTMIRAIVDDHGGDQQMQLMRQFLDSASALAYFLEDIEDTSRIDAYINDSLISEKEFLTNVHEQIRKRGGSKLPIEERIERSIAATFDAAQVKPESVPARRKNGWPNAQERLKLLGPTSYAAYRTGSDSIHGGWNDLHRNHLECTGNTFVAQYEAAFPRPQPLFAMALLGVTFARDYLMKRYPSTTQSVARRFDAYLQKLAKADETHEAYLVKSQIQSHD